MSRGDLSRRGPRSGNAAPRDRHGRRGVPRPARAPLRRLPLAAVHVRRTARRLGTGRCRFVRRIARHAHLSLGVPGTGGNVAVDPRRAGAAPPRPRRRRRARGAPAGLPRRRRGDGRPRVAADRCDVPRGRPARPFDGPCGMARRHRGRSRRDGGRQSRRLARPGGRCRARHRVAIAGRGHRLPIVRRLSRRRPVGS